MSIIKDKTRINLFIDKEKRKIIESLARASDMPLATKVMQFVDFALEFEEDKALYMLAKDRTSKKTKHIHHDEFWRKSK